MSPHVLTFTKTIIFRISLEILIPPHSYTDQYSHNSITLTTIMKFTYKIDNYHTNPLSTVSFNLKQRRNQILQWISLKLEDLAWARELSHLGELLSPGRDLLQWQLNNSERTLA